MIPDSRDGAGRPSGRAGTRQGRRRCVSAKGHGSYADRLTLEPTADHPASASDATGSLWEVIVESIGELTGSSSVIPTLMPASTDARFFRERGTTAYGVGLFDDQVSFPDFLSMFHGNDERVSLESLDLTTRVLETILERWRLV